jgi:hypothetical protein
MIGEKITPILIEIEDMLFEFQCHCPPDFCLEGFRASLKIFMDALLSQQWKLMESENMPQEDRINMAVKLGEELKRLIKTYTGIDTITLYKVKNPA